MASTSAPPPRVLYQRKTREQVAHLNPVERLLLRLFEFMASIRLAIFVMSWLIVELVIGTFIEAQVDTKAAWYFVYGNTRFSLLLLLLAINILSAALIRFPWKRNQTGFVVTHAGLLMLLFGAALTFNSSVDALMSVAKDQSTNEIFDPHREQIVVEVATEKSRGFELLKRLQVDFGPFTWGSKLWGWFPWRSGYTQEFSLGDGDRLRVVRFYDNCHATPTYVPAEENAIGFPTLKVGFRGKDPDRSFVWLQDPESSGLVIEHLKLAGRGRSVTVTTDRSGGGFSIGPIVWHRLENEAELEHFLKAVPQDPAGALRGFIGFSAGDHHHIFPVEDLQKAPVSLPGTGGTLFVAEYYANFQLDENRQPTSVGKDPTNPAVRLVFERDGAKKDFLVFADPRLNAVSRRARPQAELVTFFSPGGGPLIEVATTSDERIAARVFSSSGLLAAKRIELDEEIPAIQAPQFSLDMSVASYLPSARRDTKLSPRDRIRGGEGNNRGIVFELRTREGIFTSSLCRNAITDERAAQRLIAVGDRLFRIGYSIHTERLPFSIRLNSFEQPTDPGTTSAAMYTSNVQLIDKNLGIDEERVITMNAPLEHAGEDGIHYKLYQTSIQWVGNTPISTYTVAHDPGLFWKNAGTFVGTIGIILMFYMGGYFKRRPPAVVAEESLPVANKET